MEQIKVSTISVKKIAVLSDIHGNIAALESVVHDIQRKQVDQIINLGDHISGPLWPKETIEYLMSQDWIHILGNHDRSLISQKHSEQVPSDRYAFQFLNKYEKDWLKSLPDSIEILKGLFLFHGTPSNNNIYLLETVENGRARLATQSEIIKRLGEIKSKGMLCGHSHIPRIIELPGAITIINPGSVGLPAYDDNLPEYHVMETGSPHARYAILEYQKSIQSVELISVAYDHESAVKQAIKNKRPNWAKGLQSGYMKD
jgi:predicted phosphodiesterase